MMVDGRAIAQEILQQLSASVNEIGRAPRLGILVCSPDAVTEQYLRLKQAKAKVVGIDVQVTVLSSTATTEEVVTAVESLAATVDGVVVQLPLPITINRDQVLAAIPAAQDVDALQGSESDFVSPVVRAIAKIVEIHQVSLPGKTAVVFGAGRLVGQPVATWLTLQGVTTQVITDNDVVSPELIQAADILVLGAGQPGLLTSEMITANTIIFDAGTSESSGRVQGDADPTCGEKAALCTPVPGGIGPITVATLLENVVLATKSNMA